MCIYLYVSIYLPRHRIYLEVYIRTTNNGSPLTGNWVVGDSCRRGGFTFFFLSLLTVGILDHVHLLLQKRK